MTILFSSISIVHTESTKFGRKMSELSLSSEKSFSVLNFSGNLGTFRSHFPHLVFECSTIKFGCIDLIPIGYNLFFLIGLISFNQ